MEDARQQGGSGQIILLQESSTFHVLRLLPNIKVKTVFGVYMLSTMTCSSYLSQSRKLIPSQLILLPAVGIQRLIYPKHAFNTTTSGYNSAPSPVTGIAIVRNRPQALYRVCKDSRLRLVRFALFELLLTCLQICFPWFRCDSNSSN